MNVTLFIPCFVDTCYPQVGMHMVRILERLGHRVTCPEAVACCGQPAFNSGYRDEARAWQPALTSDSVRRPPALPKS